MRRSKYGYLLLALLVITGLAGTITSTSITSKERKFAANHLKDTKSDVLRSLTALSNVQLEFRPAPDKWSIKECSYHIAIQEKKLWQILQAAMKHPANPEKRSEIKLTDEQVVKMVEVAPLKPMNPQSIQRKGNPYEILDEALESFKTIRADHIKYVKNTTEDLRNHVIQMSFGWIDCYQLCLYMSARSNHYIQQIEDIKKDPDFPSQ